MSFNFPIPKMYVDRETKAAFVYQRYQTILHGKILDVGADQGFLKKHLPSECSYLGVVKTPKEGFLGIDLELGRLPLSENSFDTVLCLDVLEHLEAIHVVFDELCRVSNKFVLISLPNPWRTFMGFLEGGAYRNNQRIKFYGLPEEPPDDRHKWFFSSREALAFVQYRAKKNNMSLVDLFVEDFESQGVFRTDPEVGVDTRKAREHLFRKDVPWQEVFEGTQWYLLQKNFKG